MNFLIDTYPHSCSSFFTACGKWWGLWTDQLCDDLLGSRLAKPSPRPTTATNSSWFERRVTAYRWPNQPFDTLAQRCHAEHRIDGGTHGPCPDSDASASTARQGVFLEDDE